MRRFYGPDHVGRTRRRLAALIEKVLGEDKVDGLKVKVDPSELVPTQGYWRIDHRADVMPWEGWMMVETPHGWKKWQVYSWSTMTDLLRGFDWKIGRPNEVELFARSSYAPNQTASIEVENSSSALGRPEKCL